MKTISSEPHFFTRRAFVIGALQTLLLFLLGARLAWLQIAQGKRYKTLSDRNRISIKLLKPSRGQIVDRFGVPLAVNEQNFRVLLTPEQTEDIERSLRSLQKFIDLEEYQIEKVLKAAQKSAKFAPLEVRDHLTWKEVSKVEVNLPDLPGLSIDIGENRSYPYGDSTAHVVGYVGQASREDIARDKGAVLPGLEVGKTAIEKKLDLELRGEVGAAEVEVNVIGREIRELKRKPSKKGLRSVLTVDAEFQRFVQNRLSKEYSASAIVMDAITGAVYAMASHPSFDPNLFTRGMAPDLWEDLLSNPGHPLTNKAIAGQYPPASTFKMVTALAGLRHGKIHRGLTVHCPGHFDYGGNRFHCWNKAGHGRLDLVQALAQSCDTYFYQVAPEIGIDNIAAVARELGLGQKFSFDLLEQTSGLVPDKSWKMGYLGESWRPGETIISSIGQGFLKSTPLQLAVMTARLVNGGYAVQPWLVGGIEKRNAEFKKVWPKLDISQSHLNFVREGMDYTVNHKKGTAYGSRISDRSSSMGGKTGTAQVRRITQRQREQGIKNKDLLRKYRDHGLFVGYAPVKNPRYVCAVVVEHGGSGSASAAPIARDLLFEVQKRKLADTELLQDI